LLIATHNTGKQREMRALLAEIAPQLCVPADLGLALEVPENGWTYAENALRKALAFGQASGLPSLADDSGLEVDALGGEPGVRSARYAPISGATDADRRHYLLGRLSGKPRPWKAHFHCTLALAMPAGEVYFFEGNCPGEIIPEERGSGGFGYDPIFWLPEAGKTLAELSVEEKNRISHRARAVQAALPTLRKLLGAGN
jgi:XTP/dITP diphosphohydrolase